MPPRPLQLPLPLLTCLLSAIAAVALAEPWREIEPWEFELTEPEIDPGFGAEILFSEMDYDQYVEDFQTLERIQYYMRFKVYNELGVSQLADWKLVYGGDEGRIGGLEGRTVKPDGTVYELGKDQVFDTELVRRGQGKVKAKSFAFPQVEPGDIVELQYTLRSGEMDWIPVLQFQDRLPARRIYKTLKPVEYPGFTYKIARFSFPEADFSNQVNGRYVFEKVNVPAFVDEPYSFPENSLIPTVVLYYRYMEGPIRKGKSYWEDLAKELHKDGRSSLKPTREIEELADELTKGLTKDWSKLSALYDYCQEELTNLRFSRGVMTAEERGKIKEKGKPKETLSRGNGWPDEITGFFGALANAAGFEARWVAMHDNRFLMFQPWMRLDFVMQLRYIAIDVEGETRFFRPGHNYLPCGDVEWYAGDGLALIAAPKKGELQKLELPDASYSTQKRTLTGEIDESGTLKAEVRIVLTGHAGFEVKDTLSSMKGREERVDYFQEQITDLMPQATFGKVTFRNMFDHNRALIVTYDLEIPGYADVTRRRMYVQPFVFGKEAPDVFVRDERNSPLFFNYPSTEQDEISIQLPEGFELEEGSAPAPFELHPLGEYSVTLKMTSTGKVIYERLFRKDMHMLSPKGYKAIKNAFSALNARDQHALSFKRVDP